MVQKGQALPERIGELERHIETIMDESGHRSTSQRKLLAHALASLARSGTGFTAEELWQELRSVSPTIGRATVFRSVKTLVDQKVLDSIDFLDGARLYRACGPRLAKGGHHHHLACLHCKKISEFHFCLGEDELNRIACDEHFRMQTHSLTIYGLCAACSRTEARAKGTKPPPASG
ncbi:MAG: Fur family transcriptional regulator [Rectinemataceae bacterium]